METWELGQIADSMAAAKAGSAQHCRASAEILRRQTLFQEEACAAQIKAAEAVKQTANYTCNAAQWMLLCVAILAISAALQALFTVLEYFEK